MKRPYTTLLFSVILAGCLLCSSCHEEKMKRPVKSVLILGNSIVQHGPAPQIGWTGDWGMAASTRDSDFVHLLIAEIKTRNPSVTVAYANIGGFEWQLDDYDYGRVDTLIKPDMLILRFSENVNDSTAANGALIRNYDKLIKTTDPENKAVKVIVSGIWHRPNTYATLKEYAEEHHYIFVRNDDLLSDSTNTAKGLFNDTAVAAHPSDKGMRKIKERIWEKIKSYF